jgi:hypothetical protein
MKSIVALSTVVLLVLTSFSPENKQFCKRQGLKGHVYLVSGNQMPSPDAPRTGTTGMKTTLYIYELTNTSQTDQEQGAFYRSITSRLVKEVNTDENGYFKVKLKPGRYSLFVKKGSLFYSNIYDEHSNIHPVEVNKGDWTEVNFKADYDAAY